MAQLPLLPWARSRCRGAWTSEDRCLGEACYRMRLYSLPAHRESPSANRIQANPLNMTLRLSLSDSLFESVRQNRAAGSKIALTRLDVRRQGSSPQNYTHSENPVRCENPSV